METIRILVVDDEPGLRQGVERVLKDYRFFLKDIEDEVGCVLEIAESGEDALKKLEAQHTDLVLLDHKLPGISGMEVLERLPKGDSETLVIIITAYASIETAVKAIKQGAYDFLPKPFTPAELRNSVQKAAVRLVLARRTRMLAEERKQVRLKFIRVLGHELKAPLGAVENFLNLMRRKTLGDQLAPYSDVVERSMLRIGQMRKLIEDLLDMTKIESGQRKRELVELNLREVADASLELVRIQAAERGISLTLESPDLLPLTGDRIELEMILNNLISNAVKYNRAGGSVTVSLVRNGRWVTIDVTDTGIGMSEEEQSKLFGEFVRIKNEKTTHILGSGLGLSILKKLVALYEGEISVQSAPGVGSTFTVKLAV